MHLPNHRILLCGLSFGIGTRNRQILSSHWFEKSGIVAFQLFMKHFYSLYGLTKPHKELIKL